MAFLPPSPPADGTNTFFLKAWFQSVWRAFRDAFFPNTVATTSVVCTTGFYYPMDSTGGALTATLPKASDAGAGKQYCIARTAGGSNIAIIPSGTDTITGVNNLTGIGAVATFVSDGISKWYNISGSAAGAAYAPGGANTDVQYNDGGVFGGDANFTWTKATNLLDIGAPAARQSIVRVTGQTAAGASTQPVVSLRFGADEWVITDAGSLNFTHNPVSYSNSDLANNDALLLGTSAASFYPAAAATTSVQSGKFDILNPITTSESYQSIHEFYILDYTVGSGGSEMRLNTKALRIGPGSDIPWLGGTISVDLESYYAATPSISYGALADVNQSTFLTHNIYLNSVPAWTRKNAFPGTVLALSDGLDFYTTPTGAAGSGAVLTERFKINASGLVTIDGATPPNGALGVFGRTYLAPSSEPYALGLSYDATKQSSGQCFYLGASNSTTPDLILSNSAGTEKLRVGNNGNMVLGSTLASWNSGVVAFQVGSYNNVFSLGSSAYYGNNLAWTGTGGWTYVANGTASLLVLGSGGSTLYAAASGTAGGTVSLIDAFDIDSSGNGKFNVALGVGKAPAAILDVQGTSASLFARDLSASTITTLQSAMQLGLMNGTTNNGSGPSLLFHALNSAATKSFLGRISGYWVSNTSGAEKGGVKVSVRNGAADSSATTTAIDCDSTANVAVGVPSLATTATDGFLYIPTCAGTPTGVPTAKTGMVPLVYDTTNNKLWIYNGAWKGAVHT